MKNTNNKRQLHYSYAACKCAKKQTIQLGWKLYGYINILLSYPFLIVGCLLLIVLNVGLDLEIALGLVLLMALIILNYGLQYRMIYDVMSKNGHTEECARWIAFRGAPYSGYFSYFKILDEENN